MTVSVACAARTVFTISLACAVGSAAVAAEPLARPRASSTSAATYTVVDLGCLGGDSSYPYDINNLGQVVGQSETIAGDAFSMHAFLYSGGSMADLGTLGWERSCAYAINDTGQVVGEISGAGVRRAFLYSDGAMAKLGVTAEPAPENVATSINATGQVVGWSYATGEMRAVLYSGTSMALLGTLGGEGSEATGINDSGQVVGWADDPRGCWRAFLYSGGSMVDLGTLGGAYSRAWGINNAGQVVGTALTSGASVDSPCGAFLYADGTMTRLDPPLPYEPYYYRVAEAINAAGQVVGAVSPYGSSKSYAVLYEGGQRYLLDHLIDDTSWHLVAATAINDNGWIVGQGTRTGYRGTRAFLLKPAGSPPTPTPVTGRTLIPHGLSASQVRVEELDGGVVKGTTIPDDTGAFAFSDSESDWTVRPRLEGATGWEFEPAEAPAGDDNLVFSALPPPQTPDVTTEWKVGLGFSGGGWIGKNAALGILGVSAAKVSAGALTGWDLALRLVEKPGKALEVEIEDGSSFGIEGEVDFGPRLKPLIADIKPATAVVGGKVGAEWSATYGFHHVLSDQGAVDAKQRQAAAYLMIMSLLRAGNQLQPGTGLIGNVLQAQDPAVSNYVKRGDARVAAEGSASGTLGLDAKVCRGIHAGLDVGRLEVGAAGAGYATLYTHAEDEELDASRAYDIVSGSEASLSVDAGLLEAELESWRGRFGNRKTILTPWGPLLSFKGTGIVGVRNYINGLNVVSQSLRFTWDTQAGSPLFGEASDAQTVAIKFYEPYATPIMLAINASPTTPIASAVLSGQPIPLSSWPDFVTEYAQWAANVSSYAQQHPGGPIGKITWERETGFGIEPELKLDIGAGVGIYAGAKISAFKSHTYTEREYELTGDPLCAQRYESADGDSRAIEQVAGEIILGAIADLQAEINKQITKAQETISGTVGDIIADAPDALARLICDQAQVSVLGVKIRLCSYSPSIESSPGTTGVRAAGVRPFAIPYRWRGVTAMQGTTLTEVASAGDVRVVDVLDASDQTTASWPAGAATLRVKVTAQDLTDRGLDPALLSAVQIYYWDATDALWEELATTRDGDWLVAQPTKRGEYMPAVSSSLVDQQPPRLVSWPTASGADLQQDVLAPVTIEDQPTGRSVGVDMTSAQATVDGSAVAVRCRYRSEGRVEVLFAPTAAMNDGATHSLSVTVADLGGRQAVLGPFAFRVCPTADVNGDGNVDGADLGAFARGWRGARSDTPVVDPRCDLAPLTDAAPSLVHNPDGQINADDARAFLEAYLHAAATGP